MPGTTGATLAASGESDMNADMRRRTLLAGIGCLGGVAIAGCSATGAEHRPRRPSDRNASSSRDWFDLDLVEDDVMNSQLLHFLGATYSGQADIGEVLDTGTRIRPGDEWSWPDEWVRTAQRVQTMAERSERRHMRISAGKAYLRAANYYRAALIHHPDPGHRSVLRTGRSAVAAYEKALDLLQMPAMRVSIPYEGQALPGYFFRAESRRGDAPLLIFQQGRDAWPEESKHIIDDALVRGYHCLIVHAPGQGMAIRELDLPFRPDWENVVRPIIDFALSISGIDARRIALLGWSMGGALTPRAAAFDHRIRLLVTNPGVLDWGQTTYEQMTGYLPEVMQLLPDAAAFDAAMSTAMKQSALIRWYMRDAMSKHGVGSPSAYMHAVAEFTNEPVAHRIRARTLVMDGTGEAFSVGQARLLFDALRCPKDFMLFDEEDTGLLHCQEAASAVSNHRLFDWIDEYI